MKFLSSDEDAAATAVSNIDHRLILRRARSFPPGPSRNQRRQAASSLPSFLPWCGHFRSNVNELIS
jgi:hypothetical protein